MKAKQYILAALLFGTAAPAMAQTREEENEARRQYYYNYSRWTLGLNGGLSALFGDFTTFSDEKTYISPIGSAFVSYQLNPTIGFTLEGYYSHNTIGAFTGNKDHYLNTNGFRSDVAANPLTGEQFLTYGELYSKVNLVQGRFGMDINLSNVFGGNKGNVRNFSLLFSPSYYLQYYRPKVYKKADDQRYTSRDLFYQVNNGVGGELTARFRLSRVIDLQLKGGGVYGFNKKFDGVAGGKKTNVLAYVQAGIAFKLNGKCERDNLMYAATPAYVPVPLMPAKPNGGEPVVIEKVVHDTVTVTRVERVEVPVEKIVYRTVGTLPSVGFERGKAVIDTEKYAGELSTIVELMNKYSDIEIDIYGWADHTGGDNINSRITTQRAEALRDYLVGQGISASRIHKVEGCGKDSSLSGEDALSVKARRAQPVMR
ncbi:MAG: OmpA family protein [Alloprevotella sp.]|nr:OmpA family protein [Alloprevotella sp.]